MDAGYRAIKEVVAQGPAVAEGMRRLVDHCEERYPHQIWKEMRELPYPGGADAIEAWFAARLPIPAQVAVLWFALWDVTTGFDLRGSSSWSRDPGDWEWWYHDDFDAGAYESRPLEDMHELARRVEDPNEGPDVEGGVRELMDDVLTLGFVSLAAQQAIRALDPADVLADRDELAVVSGFPDAGFGLILGRLTASGFEAGEGSYRKRKQPPAARRRRVREARVYQLNWDDSETDRWLLDYPVDGSGEPLEPDTFACGARVDVAGELRIPLLRPGGPLELNVAPMFLVASERIGSLLGELAPQDLQRLPARVDSASERYEVLNTLSRIDCVDRERTEATVFSEAEGLKTGTLASLAPLLQAEPELTVSIVTTNLRLHTEDLGGARVFRVPGSDLFPMITHEVRVGLEAEGVRGVVFNPLA